MKILSLFSDKGRWLPGEGKTSFHEKRNFSLPRTPSLFKKSGVFYEGKYLSFRKVCFIPRLFQEKRSILRGHESGQATIELLVLLIGFVSLFLGLVFVCGLADGDIGILLNARNNAELLASGSGSNTVTGPEFGAVTHGTHEIYSKEEYLVFSPQDYVGKTINNTIDEFPAAFSSQHDSVLSDSNRNYRLQAEMKEWKNIRNAGNGVFKADFVSGLSTKNALEAADLVSATSSERSVVTTLSGKNSDDFFSGFIKWFGIRLSSSALKRAPGNRVYMPLFSPKRSE